MLKQTFLSFKGALGFITTAAKRGEEDGDSGVSSASNTSDDEKDDIKDHYTSTAILVPAGQSINQINVVRLGHKEISAELDVYSSQCKTLKRYCRVFDTKALVKKSDNL